jgi:hypothetical protein
MNEGDLFFNGVNGATGSYGLRPMTRKDLADHILRGTGIKSDERKKVEGQLKRGHAKKLAAIVRLLAKSSLEKVERDAAWESTWLRTLAEVLATEFLGDEHAEPDRLKALEDRLRRHTEDKIVDIVTLLVEGKAEELAKLLLEDQDEEPDNQGTLKEQLKRDAIGKMIDVQRDLLAASCAEELEREVTAQNDWLESLITSLQVVPIKALNALKGVRVRPLEPLIKELDALAGDSAAPSPWLEALRRDLNTEPKPSSWSKLLETLRRGLEARIADQGDAISWGDLLTTLKDWLTTVRQPIAYLGVIEGVDPTDLAQAGWGIIFPYEDPRSPQKVPGIKKALQPLLDLRRSQADKYFKIYEGGKGFRFDDTARKFLARYGAVPSDPADPEKVPYYLLIVGSPEEIPFHFQYQLDVQYAVGRIHFDELEDYAHYARSVVAVEKKGGFTLAPKAAFFGAANRGDPTTELSAEHLVKPLYKRLKERHSSHWQIDAVLRDKATRGQLMDLMGGDDTPALLFAACHGIEFPKDDPQGRQARYQGALLCQEWQRPEAGQGKVPRDYYLAGEDLTGDANLLGLIAFFFACYSAGTPRFDEYYKQAFKERGETIAERPFIAALPKAMLSLPRGGALAVVGHVERAWGTSFLGPRQSEQIAVFESAVERLLKGHPIGSAMEYFNGRYAAMSSELTNAIERSGLGGRIDDYELAEMWTANNDARGYIVIGDPAVRLPVAETAKSATGRRDL